MIPLAMEFITITTGATSMARRADLTEDTMSLARSVIGGGNVGGWSVEIVATHPSSHYWSISFGDIEVSRCFLCVDNRSNDVLLEIAERLAPPNVVLHKPRGVPWLAVALSPDAIRIPKNALLALSWLEMAVAWAILETP